VYYYAVTYCFLCDLIPEDMLTPAQFLRYLTPTRTILCVVATRRAELASSALVNAQKEFLRPNLDACDFGIAVSDPYLSHSKPLSDFVYSKHASLLYDLPDLMRENDAGGLLIGMPILADKNPVGGADTTVPNLDNKETPFTPDYTKLADAAGIKDQDALQCAVQELFSGQAHSFSETLLVSTELVCDLTNAAFEFRENILWDSLVELGGEQQQQQQQQQKSQQQLCPSTHAGVSLQLYLDEHCGGWQNTFG
jgi:hypothetical protein